ncbi:hypothetical protein [Armatimonas sp.]|uniref:hypothetical protein n=1 Tax=Armatimonas sp. TaxID=1872638 RepID=UPI00374D793C
MARIADAGVVDTPPPGTTTWTAIKQYMDCPKRFWYMYHAGLSERGDRSYLRFRRALYGAFIAAANLAAEGDSAKATSEIHQDLDHRFDAVGLATFGDAAVLRRNGHIIAKRFCTRLQNLPQGHRLVVRPWIQLAVGDGGTIVLQPAEIQYEGDVAVIARLHFFKPCAASHHERPDAALLYAALGLSVRVEFWYPLEDNIPCVCMLEERRPEALPPGSRKDQLSTVVKKHHDQVKTVFLQLQAEVFDPKPDDHTCGGCGFQYTCPGLD